MIRRIRSISKPSGGWGTKWNSLQLRLLAYFFLSLLISLVFYHLTIRLSGRWERERNTALWNSQKELSDERAGQLVRDLRGLDDREAAEFLKEYDHEHSASIILINSRGKMLYRDLFEVSLFDDNDPGLTMPYVNAPVELAEGTGLIIYQDVVTGKDLFSGGDDLLLGLTAGILFFLSFFFLSRRILLDIRHIAEQVERISAGDLNARVKLPARDELSRLGENINRMSGSIRSMVEEIRRSEQRSRELISGLSHDLKTPLTSIIGFLNLLREAERQNLSRDDQIRYTDLCFSQSLRLKKLVNDLFLYVKYTDSSLKLNRLSFSFRTLTEQVLDEHSGILKEKGIRFVSDTGSEDFIIHGDPDHIARVLNNLMENLELYCDTEKEARLTLSGDSREIRLQLTNTARNLNTDNPEHLFERMVRGDSARSSGEGSGLGLAISREIVRLHGGTIGAETGDGRFTVTLTLPYLPSRI